MRRCTRIRARAARDAADTANGTTSIVLIENSILANCNVVFACTSECTALFRQLPNRSSVPRESEKRRRLGQQYPCRPCVSSSLVTAAGLESTLSCSKVTATCRVRDCALWWGLLKKRNFPPGIERILKRGSCLFEMMVR